MKINKENIVKKPSKSQRKTKVKKKLSNKNFITTKVRFGSLSKQSKTKTKIKENKILQPITN